MTQTAAKRDIRSFNSEEINNIIESLGEKKFRAKQIYDWIWTQGVTSFDAMTNLSVLLREKLKESYYFNTLTLDKSQLSDDGTYKVRYRLHDGHLIETVMIPVASDKRFTVCVSTQVGCSLTCKFCATGQMGRIRNLDASEIYDQVVLMNRFTQQNYEHPVTNVVYMGMGEPLLTYKNMMESVERITTGLTFSPKRITVSSAGIAKMIRKLADDNVKFNLAISLHAADDEKRNEIMPINEQNNLEVLMDALSYFYETTKNRITYEYIAFKNFNDSIADAYQLIALCKKFPVRVNIIEYNTVDGVSFTKSEDDTINQFAQILRQNGVMVTVRQSRGKDIDAACGQLANK